MADNLGERGGKDVRRGDKTQNKMGPLQIIEISRVQQQTVLSEQIQSDRFFVFFDPQCEIKPAFRFYKDRPAVLRSR